jgi:predicted CXXCH cytochrome family protein
MRPTATWMHQATAGLACVVLVASCSSETKQRLLHVFFTGVDGTNAPPKSIGASPGTNALARPAAAPAEPVVYQHQPYLERKCDACHVTGQSEALRVSGGALCLECHAKVAAPAKYIHAPVEEGRCDQCHEAHKSTERALLTRRGSDVCLSCHELVYMTKIKGHAKTSGPECWSCHDAHRSDNKYLVKALP